MTIVLTVCGIACLLYFAALLIFSGLGTSFAFIWLFFAAVFFGAAGGWKFRLFASGRLPLWVKVSVFTVFGAALVIFAVVEFLIFTGVTSYGEPNLDYVIVLGAKVKRNGISKSLAMRLDRAIEYGEANPNTIFVLSGGKGKDEPMTEAKAMKDYMVYNGIREEQIILEERSSSTVENIAYSRVAIEEDIKQRENKGDRREKKEPVKIGVVTSDFHVFRAKQIGKKWGIPDMYGIASPSSLWLMPHFCVRECAAILKDKLMGNM